MNRIAHISAEQVLDLNLHDGDRVFGQVHGGVVELQVESDRPTVTRISGSEFVRKWRGQFKNDAVDFSDDPRAQAILNR